jgi:zinc protease
MLGLRVGRFGCIVALGFVSCIAPPRPATSMATATAIHHPIAQLTNASGMRTVFEVSPDFGVAGAVLVVGAGGADDPPDKEGLAHLVEHLVLLQSRRGDVTFRDRLLALGAGAYNGMTWWDETRYYAFGPSRSLLAILSLFAEMLDDPLASVDEAAFEHERGIVRNEMRLRTEDGTPGEALGLLASDVFPAGHPYARPVVGTERSIDHLTLADARAFAAAHYRAASCVLAVSSPLSLDAQKSLLEQAEAGRTWPWKSDLPAVASRRPPAKPAASSRDVATAEANVPTPTLWIGWAIPSRVTPEADAATFVSDMAPDTFWNHVYDRDSDIAYVHADVLAGRDASLFYVEATLKDGRDPRASADSLLHTMGRGLGEVTSSQAFALVKQNLAAHAAIADEGIVARTLDLASSIELTGAPAFALSTPARTQALTADAVADFYGRYLGADRAHVMLVRPTPKDGDHPTVIVGSSGGKKDESPNLQRRPAPAPADVGSWIRPMGLSNGVRTTLPNGMELVVVPRPGSSFHSVIVAYHGGRGDERAPGAAVASLWAKQRLAGGEGSWDLAYFDRVNRDTTVEIVRAAGSDLRPTLKRLRHQNEFRVFWPPPQFSTRIEAFEKEERSPDETIERRLAAALFGKHPYGHVTTSADLRAVHPKDVNVFLDAIRRPQNGMIAVVGDLDPSSAEALVTSEFGSAGRASDAVATLPPVPPLEQSGAQTGERLVVQDRPAARTVKMTFRCALPRADEATSGTAWLFATALADRFEGVLREWSTASYGVHKGLDLLRGGTAIAKVTADLDYDHMPLAVRTLRAFVDRPASTSFDAQALGQGRAAAARIFNLENSTTEQIALAVVEAWNLGWPFDTRDHFPEQVAGAKLEDVVRLAEHCRSNWVAGFLGDEARMRASLAGWNP